MSGIGLTNNLIHALSLLSESHRSGARGFELPVKSLFAHIYRGDHRAVRADSNFVRACRLLCKKKCVVESTAVQTSFHRTWKCYTITPKGMASLDRHTLTRKRHVSTYQNINKRTHARP